MKKICTFQISFITEEQDPCCFPQTSKELQEVAKAFIQQHVSLLSPGQLIRVYGGEVLRFAMNPMNLRWAEYSVQETEGKKAINA